MAKFQIELFYLQQIRRIMLCYMRLACRLSPVKRQKKSSNANGWKGNKCIS